MRPTCAVLDSSRRTRWLTLITAKCKKYCLRLVFAFSKSTNRTQKRVYALPVNVLTKFTACWTKSAHYSVTYTEHFIQSDRNNGKHSMYGPRIKDIYVLESLKLIFISINYSFHFVSITIIVQIIELQFGLRINCFRFLTQKR